VDGVVEVLQDGDVALLDLTRLPRLVPTACRLCYIQSVSNVVRIPGILTETMLMAVRIRLFFMRIRILSGSESAFNIAFMLVISSNDSNVGRIPVVEVFLIVTMLMPVRIRLF
jgi:hypothetical protein